MAPPPFQTLVRPLLAFPSGPLFPFFPRFFLASYHLSPARPLTSWVRNIRLPVHSRDSGGPLAPTSSVHFEDPKKTSKILKHPASPRGTALLCPSLATWHPHCLPPLNMHLVAHTRPFPRFRFPLLRDQPAARPARPRFVDKLHSPPQTNYRFSSLVPKWRNWQTR